MTPLTAAERKARQDLFERLVVEAVGGLCANPGLIRYGTVGTDIVAQAIWVATTAMNDLEREGWRPTP